MFMMNSQVTRATLFCLMAVVSRSSVVHSSFLPHHCGKTTQQRRQQHQSRNHLVNNAAVSGAALRFRTNSAAVSSIRFDRSLVTCNAAKPPRRSTPSIRGDFEYEELVVQMKAMQTSKLVSDDLSSEKRRELQEYVLGILQKRASPIPLTEMGPSLAYTSWRLSYSTEGFASSGLPRGAAVRVEFLDDTMATYSLEFGEKTFGLKNLKATSNWSCGTSETAMDPSKAGVVTLTYDKITTDVFGFSNIGVGLFGMLKGRSNYIQTVYFDGTLWIEEGYGPSGEQYLNVYMNEDT